MALGVGLRLRVETGGPADRPAESWAARPHGLEVPVVANTAQARKAWTPTGRRWTASPPLPMPVRLSSRSA